MSQKCTYLLGIGFLILLAACSKNTSKPDVAAGSTAQLVGNYRFLYISANTNVTEQATVLGQAVKVVSTSSYTTTDSTGTAVFTADSVYGNGLGYSVNSTVTAVQYLNGVAQDTTTQPFSQTVPPTSSASKYQAIGTDSLYFPGGALGIGGATSGTPIAPPTGGHYSFKGDTLFITTKINQTYPDQVNGVATTATAIVDATIVLLKL